MNNTIENYKTLGVACLVLAALAGGSPVHAKDAACTFVSSGLAMGSYDDSSTTDLTGVGTVEVSCISLIGTIQDGVSVALDLGASSHGTVSNRKMASGTHLLDYSIYSDSARSLNWGAPNIPTLNSGRLDSNTSRPVRFTLYGRIPALQNVPAGSYSDSVSMTVSP